MPDIPSLKAPSIPNLPSVPNVPSVPAFNSSIGSSLPSAGGLTSGLTSKLPDAGALKSAVPTFSAPSLPGDLSLGGNTQLAPSLPKFDSKIELPEMETGKLGLLSSPTDLGTFNQKTMSSLNSLVPPFSPGTKISGLKDMADKKSALMDSLKSAAGGALGAAAGAALAGGNLKKIAGAAAGAAAGGLAGGLASQAGLGKNVTGAIGSAAGVLAGGGNLKQAALSAGGGLVAGALTDKLGGGAVGSAVGGIAGAKLAGASTKTALIGGLTAGAGALIAQKIFSPGKNLVASLPTTSAPPVGPISSASGATTVAAQEAAIPSSVEVVTSTSNPPEPIEEKVIPPESPIATIDKDTGAVVLSNTDSANLTTVKETVVGGGSRTRYADKIDPVTGKSIPVPDKIEPPTKTETTTVINKSTGEVVSSNTQTTVISNKEAAKSATSANIAQPKQEIKQKLPPKVIPRPINPLFEVKTDLNGNEYLALNYDDYKFGKRLLISNKMEMISIVGSKDTLTITYEDGSTRVYYTPEAAAKKFNYTEEELKALKESAAGSGLKRTTVAETAADGKTSTYFDSVRTRDDYSLPQKNERPYFVKSPDGTINYTFSDGTTATELQTGGKSIITINGVSAELDVNIVKPSSEELKFPKEIADKKKDASMREWNKTWKWDVKLKEGKITQKDYDEIWNDYWLGVVANMEQEYAFSVIEKYEKLNKDQLLKTAESIDKNYVIEVTRNPYGASWLVGSLTIKSIRVYKKIEEL